MKVTLFGTRGSTAVAGTGYQKYGGNTTCLQVESDSLPPGHFLAIDAGTGIVPLGIGAIKAGVKELTILFTHYHHDHTQGALLCPLTYMKQVQVNCYGPVEYGVGPLQMFEHNMQPPYFPVKFATVKSHFACKGLDHPESAAIIIHPEGGTKLFQVDALEGYKARSPHQVPMNGGRYPLSECLEIAMMKTEHPEYALSYRLTEGPTGRVFVLATDHENTDGVPAKIKRHLEGADLLLLDSQYGREHYEKATAGFGHGTPDYCVRLASASHAARLGLTHHDPAAFDPAVEEILAAAVKTAEQLGYNGEIFSCADYTTIEV